LRGLKRFDDMLEYSVDLRPSWRGFGSFCSRFEGRLLEEKWETEARQQI
jgi:hypothetical protein